MSKKMLKRSLTLSALMAFVITGSAMAAVVDFNDSNTAFQAIDGIFPSGSVIAKEVSINNTKGSAINAYGNVVVKAEDGDVSLTASNYAIQTGVEGQGDNADPNLKISIAGSDINLTRTTYGWVTKMEVGSTELKAENDITVNGTHGLSNNSHNGIASVNAGGSISVTATSGGAVSNIGAGWNLNAGDSINLTAADGKNAIYSQNGSVAVSAGDGAEISGNIVAGKTGSTVGGSVVISATDLEIDGQVYAVDDGEVTINATNATITDDSTNGPLYAYSGNINVNVEDTLNLKGEKRAIKADGDGAISVNADKVNIATDEGWAVATEQADGRVGKIEINATDLDVDAAYGVTANGGSILLDVDDNATIKAITALRASSDGEVTLEADGETKIEGNIYTKDAGKVQATLNGENSYLTGKVTTTGNSSTTLTLNDATWNVTGDSTLSVLAGSGANINVGAGVTSITIGKNQNDDVNVSKDANGSAATDQALVDLKNVLKGDVADMNIDTTLTNAAITGDVTLDASGKKITTLYTKLNVTDGLKVNTSGEGSFSIGNIGGNTLFYGMSTDAGKSNPTIVMNAQNGNIETQGSLSVGNGAFVSDAASGNASVAGSLEVGGDAGIADGLNVGTDVVAEGDVYAGDVSLKETAAKVENNEKAIGENRNDIEANREAIEDVQDVANKNAGDIAVNKEAIKELQDATNKNTADIAVNKEAIEANKQAIADEAAAREAADKALSDAIDNVVGDIADTKAQVEDNEAAIEQNAQDLANEVADRVAADDKLQQKLDKESVDRQIADAQERAERAQADQELQANIDKEVQERQAADAREAQIRSNEDQRIESKFDGEVNRLDNRIDKVEDRVDKVGAMAAAMASLRTMGYDPEAPTEIAVGIGQYRSETGLAIGAFHYPNKDFMLNFSLSTAGDEVMGGVGATWKIGRKKPAGETVEDKVAKAEAMKEAAKAARVKAQQVKHSEMLANKSK